MVREKRALIDEAVQDTLPTEDLSVTSRPVEDLSSLIAAEGERPGTYLNPYALKDLADISKNIHDTRRNSRQADYDIRRQEFYSENKLMIEQDKQARINQVQQNLLDQKVADYATLSDALERARNTGDSQKQVVTQFAQETQDRADRMLQESPYMYSQYVSYMERLIPSELEKATANDYELQKKKKVYAADRATAVFATRIVDGTTTAETAAEELISQQLIPASSAISDTEDIEAMNKAYNTLFLMDYNRIESLVKSGVITPEEGRTYIADSIARNQIRTYKGQRLAEGQRPGVDIDDAELTDMEVDVTLNPETIKEAMNIADRLSSPKTQMNAISAKDEYFEFTGKAKADKGEFDDIPFYRYATVAEANKLLVRTYQALAPEIAQGNSSAIKDWSEILRYHYFTVVPMASAIEALKKSTRETGDTAAALSRLNVMRDEIHRKVSNPGDFIDTNMQSLIFNSNGVVLNLNYPTDELVRHGVDSETNRRNYYAALERSLTRVIEQSNKYGGAGVSAILDPTFSAAQNNFINTLTIENLIKTDVNTGSVYPNIEGQNKTIQTWTEARKAQRAASGNMITGINTDETIKTVAQAYNSTDLKSGEVFLRSVAGAAVKTGTPDMLMPYNYAGLNSTQKAIANKTAMYSMLSMDPASSGMINSIVNNAVGGEYPNPSDKEADNLLKGRLTSSSGKSNLSEFIDAKMNEYNIPVEFRPAVRFMGKQMAVATIAKSEKTKFDGRDFDRVLSSNFSKNGTYLHSTVLNPTQGGSLNLKQADSIVTTTTKGVNRYMKGLTGKEGMTTKINQQNGNIQLYKDGQPFAGTGTYSPLRGTGRVPFEISTRRPTGMDDTKFENAVNLTGQLAVAMGEVSGMKTNANVMKYAKNIAPKVPVDTFVKDANIMLESIRNKDNQFAVMTAYNNNFKNVKTLTAPQYIKEMMYIGAFGISSSPYGLMSPELGGAGKIVEKIKDVTASVLESPVAGFTSKTPLSDKRQMDKDRKWQIDKVADYYWTLATSKTKVSLDIPTQKANRLVPQSSVSFNFTDAINKSGYFTITSTTGGKHADNSKHYTGYAADVGIPGGFAKCLDPRTGLPSNASLDKFIKAIEPMVKNGQIDTIGTSFAPLVSGMSNNSAYSKIRNMKNNQGKPLFVYYSTGHFDHYHVNFNKKAYEASGKATGITLNDFIYEASVLVPRNLNKVHSRGYIRQEQARALARTFPSYTASDWDAKNCGVPLAELKSNRYAGQIALGAKFIDGTGALKSSNMALLGLLGAKFTFLPEGKNLQKVTGLSLERVIDFDRKKGDLRGRWVIEGDINKYTKQINNFARAMN